MSICHASWPGIRREAIWAMGLCSGPKHWWLTALFQAFSFLWQGSYSPKTSKARIFKERNKCEWIVLSTVGWDNYLGSVSFSTKWPKGQMPRKQKGLQRRHCAASFHTVVWVSQPLQALPAPALTGTGMVQNGEVMAPETTSVVKVSSLTSTWHTASTVWGSHEVPHIRCKANITDNWNWPCKQCPLLVMVTMYNRSALKNPWCCHLLLQPGHWNCENMLRLGKSLPLSVRSIRNVGECVRAPGPLGRAHSHTQALHLNDPEVYGLLWSDSELKIIAFWIRKKQFFKNYIAFYLMLKKNRLMVDRQHKRPKNETKFIYNLNFQA